MVLCSEHDTEILNYISVSALSNYPFRTILLTLSNYTVPLISHLGIYSIMLSVIIRLFLQYAFLRTSQQPISMRGMI